MKRLLCILLALCLLLLVSCAGGGGGATDDNLAPTGYPASENDVPPEPDTRTQLLSGGGRWRSEQQTAIDPGVIVRELTLFEDGKFTYREGDRDSEFSYFAAGSWTSEGDFLRLDFVRTEEDFAPLPDAAAAHAQYAAAFQDGGLSLRQSSDTGLADGQPGMTVYYYNP